MGYVLLQVYYIYCLYNHLSFEVIDYINCVNVEIDLVPTNKRIDH